MLGEGGHGCAHGGRELLYLPSLQLAVVVRMLQQMAQRTGDAIPRRIAAEAAHLVKVYVDVRGERAAEDAEPAPGPLGSGVLGAGTVRAPGVQGETHFEAPFSVAVKRS